jgi:hypothetical protein
MERTRCAACGNGFTPQRPVANQRYCSKGECQRERRRRWQRQKLREDPDYRANQSAAQGRWRERHRDYWRRYRQSHPDYTARNRAQQRQRNRRKAQVVTGPSASGIAKMDVCEAQTLVVSGTYRLIPVAGPGIAKMDAYVVEMRVLSAG